MIALASSLALSIAVAAAIALAFIWFWPSSVPLPAHTGEKGRRRKHALYSSGWFRLVEPFIRNVSFRISSIPIEQVRIGLEQGLNRAGHPMGICANEFLALTLISSLIGGAAGGAFTLFLDRSAGSGLVIGFVFGAALPWLKLDEAKRKLRIGIARSLPQGIDLVALAMEAGLDFPGAVAQVASQLRDNDPIRFEFEHLLYKLSLGWSKQKALEDLSARIPIASVQQFVSSVGQAERRGTPLANVLRTQAQVMRTHRSQCAEQAASRAAVLIIGPLMLIFCCVFIILVGPFIIKMIRGGLF